MIHRLTRTKSLQTDNTLMYKEMTKHGPCVDKALGAHAHYTKPMMMPPCVPKALYACTHIQKDNDDALIV